MRPIPPKLRKQLADDPFMKKCVWTGETVNVSWEHCWIYGGKQINEAWAIVPLRKDLNTSGIDANIKNYCRWVSLQRASEADLAKYPKFDWAQTKRFLESKYGKQ